MSLTKQLRTTVPALWVDGGNHSQQMVVVSEVDIQKYKKMMLLATLAFLSLNV